MKALDPMNKALLSLLLLLAVVTHSQARQPNVILIYTDDQGTIDVNCYGAKDLTTPHMDGLAKPWRQIPSSLLPPYVPPREQPSSRDATHNELKSLETSLLHMDMQGCLKVKSPWLKFSGKQGMPPPILENGT